MAQWQIFKGANKAGAPIQIGDTFDDGCIEWPGEPGFTAEHVKAEAATRGGDSWSHMGPSTQYHERMAPTVDPLVEELSKAMANEAGPMDGLAPDPAAFTDEARAVVLRDYGIADRD